MRLYQQNAFKSAMSKSKSSTSSTTKSSATVTKASDTSLSAKSSATEAKASETAILNKPEPHIQDDDKDIPDIAQPSKKTDSMPVDDDLYGANKKGHDDQDL
jgi:hypothetical protein